MPRYRSCELRSALDTGRANFFGVGPRNIRNPVGLVLNREIGENTHTWN